MELRQLEYFVAVATLSGFTAAADSLHTTQPNISAQIRSLEKELGAPLFHRSGRTVSLTTAGQAALPRARAALVAASSVAASVADVTKVLTGRLAVGMVEGCSVAPLFDALGTFRQAHPGVELTLAENASHTMLDDTSRATLDVALTGWSGALPAALGSLRVITEPVVAVVRDDHRLARRDAISTPELLRHDLICLPRGAGIRAVFDQATGSPRVALEASSPDAILALVDAGIGIGILSRSIADATDRQVTGLPIRGLTTHATLGFVWAEPISPVVDAFMTHVRDAFDLHSPAQ